MPYSLKQARKTGSEWVALGGGGAINLIYLLLFDPVIHSGRRRADLHARWNGHQTRSTLVRCVALPLEKRNILRSLRTAVKLSIYQTGAGIVLVARLITFGLTRSTVCFRRKVSHSRHENDLWILINIQFGISAVTATDYLRKESVTIRGVSLVA